MQHDIELMELKIRQKKILTGIDEFELSILKLGQKIEKLQKEKIISKQAADDIEIKIKELQDKE
jgi:hypothetical protein